MLGHAGGDVAPAQIFGIELGQVAIHVPPGHSNLEKVRAAVEGATLAAITPQQLQAPVAQGIF